MADDVQVRFGASIGELISGVDRVKEAIESVGEPINAINEKFRTLAEIVGVSLGVEGVKSFIESMAELGDRTETSMAQLGISAESITTLSGVAKVSGSDFGAMQQSIERLSLRVQEAAKDAFGPAAQGLKVLGINAKELAGLPADQYFERLSEAVGKFNPSLNLTNALMATGGRGVTAILPLLLSGTEHFKELAAAVEQTGSVLSGAQAKAFAESHEKLELLSLSVQGLGIRIFDTLKPAIDAAVDGLARLAQSISSGDIRTAANGIGNTLINVAEGVALFFINVRDDLDRLIASALKSNTVLGLMNAGVAAIIGSATALNAAIDFVTGQTREQNKALTEAALQAHAAREAITAFAESARTALNEAVPKPGTWAAESAEIRAMGAAMDEIAEKYTKINAAGLDSAGRDRLQAQLEASHTYIKQLDVEYTQTVEHLSAQVKTFQITESQKTQAVQDAIDDRLQDTMDELRRELAFYGLTAAQIQKIYGDMAIANTDAVSKGLKNTDQAFEAATKQWEKALSPLQQAWDSQLRGLLAGTTTWAQASKSIAADLVLKLIELNETRILHWVAGELAQTTATTTGVAARTAAEQSGNSISLAGQIAKALQSIGTDAAKVYADVFAYLAPAMGPFAAAPAAAASVTVLAAKALIPSADVGGYVNTQGIAMVHAGESIVPANLTQPFAPGGSGGGGQGGTVNFHISTMDQNGVNKWVNDNKALISRVVFAHMNSQPGSFAR